MVDIVVTAKCNLRCKKCSHLIPYYSNPQHQNKDVVITSVRKLNESFDWCNCYSVLGGEPFLNPDLKYILEEVPTQKCNILQIETNGTVIPDDPELLDVIRRKKIRVTFTDSCAHLCDLGFCEPGKGVVDLLHNSAAKNRRLMRKLICQHSPMESCQYCLRGTADNVKIGRGDKI